MKYQILSSYPLHDLALFLRLHPGHRCDPATTQNCPVCDRENKLDKPLEVWVGVY